MRTMTNALLEAVDEGLVDTKQALLAALVFMSEDDVAEMIRVNALLGEDEDEDEDEEDDEEECLE